MTVVIAVIVYMMTIVGVAEMIVYIVFVSRLFLVGSFLGLLRFQLPAPNFDPVFDDETRLDNVRHLRSE